MSGTCSTLLTHRSVDSSASLQAASPEDSTGLLSRVETSAGNPRAARRKYRIAIVVGETSGDNLAAGLMDALARRGVECEVFGICGPAMIRRKAKAIHTLDSINSIGVEGLFGKVAKILRIRRSLVRELLQTRPDAYIGVDAPDFNLGVEVKLRRAGIPTIQYVSPAVWAWRSYRIRKIKRAATRVLTIYPFESELFNKHRISHAYVGHPLADSLQPGGRAEARERLGLESEDTVVALLPGSRLVEVKHLGPLFAEVAELIASRRANIKFIMPAVSDEIRKVFDSQIRERLNPPEIKIVDGQSLDVMRAADAIVLASGTAALEAALLGRPMVVAYKMSRLSYILVKLLSSVRHYCVLNHLTQMPVIPEFMQADATAQNIVSEFERLLDNAEYRERMIGMFGEISAGLKRDANNQAAFEVAKVLRDGD